MEKKNRKLHKGLAIVSAVLISASFAMPSYAEKTVGGQETTDPVFQAEWKLIEEHERKDMRYFLDNLPKEKLKEYSGIMGGYAPLINDKSLIFGSQEGITLGFTKEKIEPLGTLENYSIDTLKSNLVKPFMLGKTYRSKTLHVDGILKKEYDFMKRISVQGYFNKNNKIYLNITVYAIMYAQKDIRFDEKTKVLTAINDYAIDAKTRNNVIQTLELKAGEKRALVNGIEVKLANKVEFKDGSLFLEKSDFEKVTKYQIKNVSLGDKEAGDYRLVYYLYYGKGKSEEY